MEVSCEHGNNASGSKKYWEILESLATGGFLRRAQLHAVSLLCRSRGYGNRCRTLIAGRAGGPLFLRPHPQMRSSNSEIQSSANRCQRGTYSPCHCVYPSAVEINRPSVPWCSAATHTPQKIPFLSHVSREC
jgi:hypothetical protein